MTAARENRRVLIVAVEARQLALRELFAAGWLPGWEPVPADGFEQARFLLQHDAADVVLVDESLFLVDERDGLAWLGGRQEAPVVLLADLSAAAAAAALQSGVSHWLPRRSVLECPALLAAVLDQAARLVASRRAARRAADALREARRQVDRLVGRLWASAPLDGRTGWFTQRHMLERLHEEVARTARHGTPFTVVLGEVRAGPGQAVAPGDESPLATWSAERINRARRRCDVVGHYGPHGFMLLLPGTREFGAASFCRRLRAALLEAGPLGVHAAFGTAACAAEGLSPQ